MRRVSGSGLLLLITLGVTGCTGVPPFVIRSHVVDSETGKPVAGAIVEVVREARCLAISP
jgi:hypothetical protein